MTHHGIVGELGRRGVARPLGGPDAPWRPGLRRRRPRRAGLPPSALGALLGALLAAGCARELGGHRTGPRAAVRGAWARPAAAGADGALYFIVENAGPDTLAVVGARADAAPAVTLHETMQMGEGAHAMAHMAPVARVLVPPGDSAVFAPLGRHAMLERLARPLAAGDSVRFALAVRRAAAGGGRVDTLRATAVVRPF